MHSDTRDHGPPLTQVERTSDVDLVVTRTFHAPRDVVFAAWTTPALFERWWVPRSAPIRLVSCELDVRTGGHYRLVFRHPAAPEPAVFFGRYLEVVPPARIVWTNEEAGDAAQITTVTFDGLGDTTRVVMHDRYPTPDALDEALASGSTNWNDETFDQLAALLRAES